MMPEWNQVSTRTGVLQTSTSAPNTSSSPRDGCGGQTSPMMPIRRAGYRIVVMTRMKAETA